jgi:hypothetical protein
VWRGGVSDKWQDPSNWFAVPPTAAADPLTAASQVLVPSWPAPYASPKLAAETQVDKLSVQPGGSVDLGALTLFIGNGGVAAPGGSLTNGTTQMLGTGTLAGSFDRLLISQRDGCTGTNASLWQVTAKTLDVFCATRVDSSARAQTLTVFGIFGALTLPNGTSSLTVTGDADFSGESLVMANGALQVGGRATFGAGRVAVAGGKISLLGGAAIFKSASASFDSASVVVQGDATFAGAGRQTFNSGTLTLGGNMAQLDSGFASFSASAGHLTILAGAKPQAISLADPDSSHFGSLRIDNPLGVTITRSTTTLGGPLLTLQTGASMGVSSGAVASLAGRIDLGVGSKLTVNGALSVISCLNFGGTIDGTGLINNAAPNLLLCAVP